MFERDLSQNLRNPQPTEGQTMTDNYVASPPTDNPADLLRERDIAIRYLLSECVRLESEVAQREVIHPRADD